MKYKTFLIISKELSIVRNCLRPGGSPLNRKMAIAYVYKPFNSYKS